MKRARRDNGRTVATSQAVKYEEASDWLSLRPVPGSEGQGRRSEIWR